MPSGPRPASCALEKRGAPVVVERYTPAKGVEGHGRSVGRSWKAVAVVAERHTLAIRVRSRLINGRDAYQGGYQGGYSSMMINPTRCELGRNSLAADCNRWRSDAPSVSSAAIRPQSGRSHDAVRTRSGRNQAAIRMKSGRNQDAIKTHPPRARPPLSSSLRRLGAPE